MGAWGYKSYENDHVMDCINNAQDKVVYEDKEWKGPALRLAYVKMLKKVIKNLRGIEFFEDQYYEYETLVGITMHALEVDKVLIPQMYLMKALRAAQLLLSKEEYLCTWKVATTRKNTLLREIRIMQNCLDNPQEFHVQVALGSI